MSAPMRLYPEDLRATASALGGLSSDTDQVQQRLDSSWGRLDSGWEWYAEEDITGYFQRASRELSLMAAMLEQMGQALVKTADLIEAADQAVVAFFELSTTEGQPDGKSLGLIEPVPPVPAVPGERGGSEDSKGIAQPPEGLEPWPFAEDEKWPNTNIPVYLNGKVWLVNNDLRDALNDPNAPLALVEDFYRWVVAPGLIAKGAPDAAALLLRSLDGETSDYQVSEQLGRELMALPNHITQLHTQEAQAMLVISQVAETMGPGEVRTFSYATNPPLLMSAYNPDEYPNSTFAMANHAGWFTWQGTIVREPDGSWVVQGVLNQDMADYSDWHGSPHDYNGDGVMECPGGQCGKTASFDLAGLDPEIFMPKLPQGLGPITPGLHRVYEHFVPSGQNTRITIPDEWMARLVIGGEASNPGFRIFFNAEQDFEFTVTDWSSPPSIEYRNLRCGDQYRLPNHEVNPGF